MLIRRTILALLALALVVPTAARAKDGGDGEGDRGDVRATGRCGHGAASKLRLRSRDGEISVEFEVRRRRSGERWRVVLVHERRVAWRGHARTGGGGSLRVRRSVDDFDGADQVTARGSGPRGITCEATATLPG